MTVLEARKVKSMLHVTTPKSKEHVELPGGIQLQFDRDSTLSMKSVTDYYAALRILCHCWAWSGNYMVNYQGEMVLMCDLTSALAYADRCLKDTMEFGGGSMKWLERNDILTRGKMATLVRRGYPAQIAFMRHSGSVTSSGDHQPCSLCWKLWRLVVVVLGLPNRQERSLQHPPSGPVH